MIHRKTLRALLVALYALLVASAAHAQLFRTYLSSAGSDANPCTLQMPCRLLPAALAAASSGGEIWILDSANYNTATVTIDKSVSVLTVPGAVGSILAIGGPAISITASGLSVALRNVVIAPLAGAGGTFGVSMTGASSLVIEHSLMAELPSGGVNVAGGGILKVANTIIRNTGGWAVLLQNGANGEVSGTKMIANAYGGVTSQGATATTTTATVSDSIMSGPSNAGVFAYTTSSLAVTKVIVTRCSIDGAINAGLYSSNPGAGSAVIAVSNSMITNNNKGWSVAYGGAIIRSLGNNHFSYNGASTGSLTTTIPQ